MGAVAATIAPNMSGKIFIQVESYGRAWYVNPADGKRYYMKDGAAAYEIMRSLSLGISNADLAKIPERSGASRNTTLVNRVKGKILLQVESRGEAWYVHPVTGIRYYMKDGVSAYEMMKSFGVGIANVDLQNVPMNETQVVHDTTFNNVAYVTLQNGVYAGGYNHNQILPLASLTKLMTALVLLDTNFNFEKTITINSGHLQYPRDLVGDDATSEIDFKLGDRIQARDVWIAMLLASSNQAAAALVESSGFTREEFTHLMNQKAQSLGLSKTVFYDVAGLDAHNVTMPVEMAVIAREAFSNPIILQASSLTSHTIAGTGADGIPRTIPVANRNYSLMTFEPEASKTGYLVEAQRTVAIKKNGKIIIVMHARSMSERNAIIKNLLALP